MMAHRSAKKAIPCATLDCEHWECESGRLLMEYVRAAVAENVAVGEAFWVADAMLSRRLLRAYRAERRRRLGPVDARKAALVVLMDAPIIGRIED